jgi:large subunit ribosomal protein L32e
MSAIEAAPHKPIIKKKTKKTARIQSDRFVRVKASWRHCRGIDSPYRRKYRGTPSHPSCGFGSDKATKGMLPNGFKPYLVQNLKDLEALFTKNTEYAAVIAHPVGVILRRKIEQAAADHNIFVVNAGARQKKQEAAAD